MERETASIATATDAAAPGWRTPRRHAEPVGPHGAAHGPYPTPSNRYPNPRTVVIHDGWPGASSLLRRRRM